MESYDEYFSQAQLYTSIHARPTILQQQAISQHQSKNKAGMMMATEEQQYEQKKVELKEISLGGILSNSALTNSSSVFGAP